MSGGEPPPSGDPLAAAAARADVLARLGRWDDLRRVAQDVLARDPERAEAYAWVAQAELSSGGRAALRRGLAAADAYVALRPSDEYGHRLRSHALAGFGYRMRAARLAAEEAIRLAPHAPAAHAQLARLHLTLGRPRAALRSAEAYVGLAPQDPDAHVLLSEIALSRLRLAAAERHARDALRRDAGHPGGQAALARALSALGRTEGAVDAAYGAAHAEPTAEAGALLQRVADSGPLGWAAVLFVGGVVGLVVATPLLQRLPSHVQNRIVGGYAAALLLVVVLTYRRVRARARARLRPEVREALHAAAPGREVALCTGLLVLCVLGGLALVGWTAALVTAPAVRPSTPLGWAGYPAAVAAWGVAARWFWRLRRQLAARLGR